MSAARIAVRPRVIERLEREYRRVATAACFACFGMLALGVGLVVCPLLELLVRDRKRRMRMAQAAMGASMRFFLWVMRASRVLTYRIEGDLGQARGGTLVIANHPSLIDVVFVMAVGGGMTCVAKQALFAHPILGAAVRSLGFIPNQGALQLVEGCVGALRAGERVLMFPEGSRTVPGQRPQLHRGCSVIAVRAGCPIVPIVIRVSEPTLYKGAPWYDVPVRRPHFTVDVLPALEAERFVEERGNPAVAARHLNRHFEEILSHGAEHQ